MTNEPKAMQEIHDIRLLIYEETKNMPEEQRIERTQKAVKEVEQKYNIKFRRPNDINNRRVM